MLSSLFTPFLSIRYFPTPQPQQSKSKIKKTLDLLHRTTLDCPLYIANGLHTMQKVVLLATHSSNIKKLFVVKKTINFSSISFFLQSGVMVFYNERRCDT